MVNHALPRNVELPAMCRTVYFSLHLDLKKAWSSASGKLPVCPGICREASDPMGQFKFAQYCGGWRSFFSDLRAHTGIQSLKNLEHTASVVMASCFAVLNQHITREFLSHWQYSWRVIDQVR